MYISMWNIVEHLKDLNPDPDIEFGERVIQNVRLSSKGINLSPSTVYLLYMDENHIECINNDDMIIVECDDITLVLNRILDVFEYYNDWQANLTKLISQGIDSHALLTNLYNVFFHSMALVDDAFFVYDHYEKPGSQPADFNNALQTLSQMPDIRSSTKKAFVLPSSAGSPQMIAYSLFNQGEHEGWILGFGSPDDFTDIQFQGELDLLAEVSTSVETWLSTQSALDGHRSTARLFSQILYGQSEDIDLLVRKLSVFNWAEADCLQLFLFQSTTGNSADQYAFLHELKANIKDAFFSAREDELALLINTNLCDEKTLRKQFSLLPKYGMIAGKSKDFTDLEKLRQAYDEAAFAMSCCTKAELLNFEDVLLPYGIKLLQSAQGDSLKHPALSTLQLYDAKHDSELLETLQVFLNCERNFTETANRLHIHRSTLIYRIERVIELTQINLDDPDERLHLLISFRL